MAKKIVKLESNSIRVGIFAFALVLATIAMANFGLPSLPNQIIIIASLAGSLIIFIEVGLVKVFGKGKAKLDILGVIGIISGVIILLAVILDLFGVSYATINGIRGVAFAVMALSFVIETFAR